jgi:hypothetical protein
LRVLLSSEEGGAVAGPDQKETGKSEGQAEDLTDEWSAITARWKNWYQQAKQRQDQHTVVGTWDRTWYILLGIAAVVLTALGGGSSLLATKLLAGDGVERSEGSRIAGSRRLFLQGGLLAVIGSIVTGIQTLLNLAAGAESHLKAARAYQVLITRIEASNGNRSKPPKARADMEKLDIAVVAAQEAAEKDEPTLPQYSRTSALAETK